MDYIKLAIRNISNFGDTDIFPFPMENALFYDCPDKIGSIIKEMEKDFDEWISSYPVDFLKMCIPVGYTGFRWVTMIDPLWNCFLLYQTLKIADAIEDQRVSKDRNTVFSYRISLDEETGKLFNKDYNWRSFYSKAIDIALESDYRFVVRFDISDFYNRVYHHRLDNALRRSEANPEIIGRIMSILKDLSGNVSYGLPIGGNAARIFAEIVLNPLDQLLLSKRNVFVRYVDDYILFADSREEAFRKLNYCADYLLRNEGLSLQKSKTQILSKTEFVSYAKALINGDNEVESTKSSDFLKLHIHFDPYSASAESDYEELKEKINQFDILDLLRKELRKSRIHQALGKQILNAIYYLDNDELNLAFNVIGSNIESLYPVFPSVMILGIKKLSEASKEVQQQFINVLYDLVTSDSYILQTYNNASYAARVFSVVDCEESIQAIDILYTKTYSSLVKYNCIYAMTNLNNHYWLSDKKSQFSSLTKWERRAFIPASYFLRDEGKHWRDHTKEQFTKLELLIRDWVALKNPIQNNWKIPL